MKAFADDIITAILTEMDIEEDPVKVSRRQFHEEIYKYKEKYPEIFEEFLFDTNGVYPYCYLIERIYMRYMISGVLEYCRGKDTFVVGHREYFYKYTRPSIDPEMYAVLEKIGKELSLKFRPTPINTTTPNVDA